MEAAKEAIRESDGARNEATHGHEDYQVLENELQDARVAKQKLKQDLAKLQESSKKTCNLLNEKIKWTVGLHIFIDSGSGS